jgi:hypothetical protein
MAFLARRPQPGARGRRAGERVPFRLTSFKLDVTGGRVATLVVAVTDRIELIGRALIDARAALRLFDQTSSIVITLTTRLLALERRTNEWKREPPEAVDRARLLNDVLELTLDVSDVRRRLRGGDRARDDGGSAM